MHSSLHKDPPTVPGLPLLGSAPALLWGDALGAIFEGMRACGDVARFRFGPVWFYGVNHPDFFRQILQDNRQNYRKSPSYNQLQRSMQSKPIQA